MLKKFNNLKAYKIIEKQLTMALKMLKFTKKIGPKMAKKKTFFFWKNNFVWFLMMKEDTVDYDHEAFFGGNTELMAELEAKVKIYTFYLSYHKW